MLTITKEFSFSAAHSLKRADLTPEQNIEIFGQCTNLHGHTYRLQVTVSGAADQNGMILHFAKLKKIVHDQILVRYHHAHLNDLAEYRDRPPTAETMACHIFDVLSPGFDDLGLCLEAISVYETPTAWATRSRHA